jgi:hypothetical protein
MRVVVQDIMAILVLLVLQIVAVVEVVVVLVNLAVMAVRVLSLFVIQPHLQMLLQRGYIRMMPHIDILHLIVQAV